PPRVRAPAGISPGASGPPIPRLGVEGLTMRFGNASTILARVPTVLLVEDRAIVLRAFAKALRLSGFDVQVAPDAKTAIDALGARSFAMILTDYDLGTLETGIDVLK